MNDGNGEETAAPQRQKDWRWRLWPLVGVALFVVTLIALGGPLAELNTQPIAAVAAELDAETRAPIETHAPPATREAKPAVVVEYSVTARAQLLEILEGLGEYERLSRASPHSLENTNCIREMNRLRRDALPTYARLEAFALDLPGVSALRLAYMQGSDCNSCVPDALNGCSEMRVSLKKANRELLPPAAGVAGAK